LGYVAAARVLFSKLSAFFPVALIFYLSALAFFYCPLFASAQLA
jgi:hypothetical protein